MPHSIASSELQQLSARGILALAARAARRLLPLVQAELTEFSDDHRAAVCEAIHLAELSTAGEEVPRNLRAKWIDVAFAAYSCREGSERAQAGILVANDTMAAAYHLNSALGRCGDVPVNSSEERMLARECARHALGISEVLVPETRRAIRKDFVTLLARAIRPEDEETMVPHDTFGPLWPDGEPDGWPRIEGSRSGRRS